MHSRNAPASARGVLQIGYRGKTTRGNIANTRDRAVTESRCPERLWYFITIQILRTMVSTTGIRRHRACQAQFHVASISKSRKPGKLEWIVFSLDNTTRPRQGKNSTDPVEMKMVGTQSGSLAAALSHTAIKYYVDVCM